MKTSMFKRKQSQGFTLIEIIIVVVILGILAAIALPKLVANLDKARAAEAFNVGSNVGKAFDRCLADETGGSAAATAANVGNCNTFVKMQMTAPTSTNFTYTTTSAATLMTLNMVGLAAWGAVGADRITFQYNGVTGQTIKTCGGKFLKMCKA